MGLLTEYQEQEKPKFDKERIIDEIKEGVQKHPKWSWFTTPDYDFDLIVIRSKLINEKIINDMNPNTLYQAIIENTYHIVYGVWVSERSCQEEQDCDIWQVGVASAKELFNIIKKHD